MEERMILMNEMIKINYPELIVDAVAVLLGDYEKYRKQAANLILKACLTEKGYKLLMEDEELKAVLKTIKKSQTKGVTVC